MPDSHYQTSDIALAAYLVLKNCTITGVEVVRAGKAAFQFKQNSSLESHVLRFFNRRAKVEPNSFLDHVKSLKAMLNGKLRSAK